MYGTYRFTYLFARTDYGSEAALQGDPGNDFVLPGEYGQLTCLFRGQCRRLLQDEIAAHFDHVCGNVIHMMRWHNRVDGVRLLSLDHRLVVRVSSGNPELLRDALTAFSHSYKAYGHYVAGYARAVDLSLNAPVHVTVVGAYGDARSHELLRAALKPYVASRVVQLIDPERDTELHQRTGLPTKTDEPTAYVGRGRESYAETTDAARLPALMTRTDGTL